MLKRIKHVRKTKKSKQNVRKLATHLTEGQLPTKAQVSLLMSVMGRKGGKIGGKRRLVTMTATERKRIAAKAANSRWRIPS
jgi:hypothetical protein